VGLLLRGGYGREEDGDGKRGDRRGEDGDGKRGDGRGREGSVVESKKILKIDPGLCVWYCLFCHSAILSVILCLELLHK